MKMMQFSVIIIKFLICFSYQETDKRKSSEHKESRIPADIHLFTVNNRITRTMCKICLKLKLKTPERHQ